MKKLSAWLFLLVAVIWLLPLVGVDNVGALKAYDWITVIAFAIIGVTEMIKG